MATVFIIHSSLQKKLKLILVLFLPQIFIWAQITVAGPSEDYYRQGSFVIKGHAENFNEPLFDFGITSYFNSRVNSIIVNPDGSFDQQFPVQYRQDVYLYLNDDAITFTVEDGDTIILNWDEKNFRKTFSIKGKNQSRTQELNFQLKLYNEFREPLMKLYEIDRNLAAEKKFELINEAYNRNVKAILDSTATKYTNRLVTSLYFAYTSLLYQFRLIPQFKLALINDAGKTYVYPGLPSMQPDYKQLNEEWFWNSPEYRDFIFNYARFYKPFTASSSALFSPKKTFNPVYDEYHLALANLSITAIQEWFITRCIIFGFERYDFAETEKVYNQVVATFTTPFLKDTLQKFYTAVKRLKPGSPAPDFALKNEKGQTVSLQDFKGKIVYIDFWGVGCGPCISAIKNHVPKFHEHYKNKNIVFVNICVDAKETQWKAALKKYNLGGVNLIAEGWTGHPVCQAYNVNGLPHYFLIDKDGKIANNNARDPGSYDLQNGKNEIDVLLK